MDIEINYDPPLIECEFELDKDYKCPGCQRAELHFMCPAYDTHFYMSGIPYTENVARIYDHLDQDDKQILFELLSTSNKKGVDIND
jgi:hypothetical protein